MKREIVNQERGSYKDYQYLYEEIAETGKFLHIKKGNSHYNIGLHENRTKIYKLYTSLNTDLPVSSAESISYSYPNGDVCEKTSIKLINYRREIKMKKYKLKYSKQGKKLLNFIGEINNHPIDFINNVSINWILGFILNIMLAVLISTILICVTLHPLTVNEESKQVDVIPLQSLNIASFPALSAEDKSTEELTLNKDNKEEDSEEQKYYKKFTRRDQVINGVKTHWIRGKMPTRYKNTVDFELTEETLNYYKYGNSCPIDPDKKNNLKKIDKDDIGLNKENCYKARIHYRYGKTKIGTLSSSTTCEVFHHESNIPGNHVIVWDIEMKQILGVYEYIYPEMDNDENFTVSIGSSIAGEDWISAQQDGQTVVIDGYIQFVDLPRLNK